MNKNKIRVTRNELMDLFGAMTPKEVPDRVMEVVLGGETAVFDRYVGLHPDLTVDHFNEAFQTLFADRVDLGQDFTPNDLARLAAGIGLAEAKAPPGEVLDEAAGVGTLTIARWAENPDVVAFCRELSRDTIPFLLFNLAVRNIEGFVVQGDTLSLRTSRVFRLSKGERYSEVVESEELARVCDENGLDPLEMAMIAYSL